VLKRWGKVEGSYHGQLTIRANKVEGEKVLHVHYLKGLEKCWVRAPYSHIGLGVGRGS
jgi:hypothetical protein